MKHAIVLAALLAAGPALAVNIILKSAPETAEEPSGAKPPTLDLKYTQVIRCVDARGNLILQGGPCLPTTADAASAAPEVTDLSALPPRPSLSVVHTVPQEPETSPFVKGALNGAWKLALLVLACYGLWRLARALRDRHRENAVRVETRRHQPRRVL